MRGIIDRCCSLLRAEHAALLFDGRSCFIGFVDHPIDMLLLFAGRLLIGKFSDLFLALFWQFGESEVYLFCRSLLW